MAEIWIEEENFTEEFLNKMDRHIQLNGDIKAVYFINEGSHDDYVEGNKDYLIDFLITQDKYPLYLTLVYIDDEPQEIIKFLIDNKIDYELKYLEEKRAYYTLFKKHQYHPPCFTVQINDAYSLRQIIDETYWLAAQNDFYAISYSNNIVFKQEMVKEWGKPRERSIPGFRIENDTTFVTVTHDGNGFYLFSNEEKFSTVKALCMHLPDKTIITQINDTLIKG